MTSWGAAKDKARQVQVRTHAVNHDRPRMFWKVHKVSKENDTTTITANKMTQVLFSSVFCYYEKMLETRGLFDSCSGGWKIPEHNTSMCSASGKGLPAASQQDSLDRLDLPSSS